MWRVLAMTALLLGSSGCLFKVGEDLGAGFVEGALESAVASGEETTSPGVNGVLEEVVAERIVAELGEQLGAGLISGAGTIDDEQRESLELLVDGVVHSALQRAGHGWHEEVAPELRRTVQQDIVDTLVTGLRGPVGGSLENVADRTVESALQAVRRHIQDPELRNMLGEMLRESIYIAVREGKPGQPGVAETLELTLSNNVLSPFEHSVDTISASVAERVDEQNRRLENTLKGIISFLVLILGVFILLFFLRGRQLDQERTSARAARLGQQELDAALQLLDNDTRTQLLGQARARMYTGTAEAISRRSGDYERIGASPPDPLQSSTPEDRSTDYGRSAGDPPDRTPGKKDPFA